MSAAVQERRRTDDAVEEIPRDPSINHYERSHLPCIGTAISLVSLGITVNRFSLYLIQNGGMDIDRQPLVEGLTLTSLFAGALSIIWMLLR